MKKLFVCAAALGLFVSGPAFGAKDDDHQGNKHDAASQGTKAHGSSGGAHQNAPAGAMMGQGHTRNVGGNAQGAMSVKSLSTSTPTHVKAVGVNSHAVTKTNSFSTAAPAGLVHAKNVGANAHAVTRTNTFSAGTPFNGNPGGNVTATHRSVNSLRFDVQAPRHYHNGNYREPQGYQYRHWSHGGRLPHAYYSRNYWILDFLTFGLFDPPDGLVWVRVGDDALLVDEISGDIVQVDYDVFY